jgi:hypothetical protein
MTVAGHWIGDLEGAHLELLVVTSPIGAWEVQLHEHAPRGGRVTRWFDAPGDAWNHAAGFWPSAPGRRPGAVSAVAYGARGPA